MTKPMSDERLAAIEAEAKDILADIDRDGMGCDDSEWLHATFHAYAYARDVPDLLAEVKRLRNAVSPDEQKVLKAYRDLREAALVQTPDYTGNVVVTMQLAWDIYIVNRAVSVKFSKPVE